MQNEILQQILSELKTTNQRLDKLERDITIIKSDVKELKLLSEGAFEDILMLDERTRSLK